ncbi:hypothetical protein DFP95_106195 [Cohnella lupini]|uniref:Uncharacterized protein n=1 Tax=Cohnella lupini TaxID=1294267 RepID=A0A3D9IFE6_9BACL|nr:hypothetical protein DFP95_106195 [Cohnella lupini]
MRMKQLPETQNEQYSFTQKLLLTRPIVNSIV